MARVCRASETWSTSLPATGSWPWKRGTLALSFWRSSRSESQTKLSKRAGMNWSAVDDLQFELDALRGELEGVGHVAERATFPQLLGDRLEIIFGG